jgi:metabotropic X receptor
MTFIFTEFWEDHFKCKYPGSLNTPYNQGYNKSCTGREKLTEDNTQFEAQLQFVSDAVMAFAHAFKYVQLCSSHATEVVFQLLN